MLKILYDALNVDEIANNKMETEETNKAREKLENCLETLNMELETDDEIHTAIGNIEEAYKKTGFYFGFKTAVNLIFGISGDMKS